MGFTVHLCLLTLRVAAFAAQVSLKENSVLSGLGEKKRKEIRQSLSMRPHDELKGRAEVKDLQALLSVFCSA